VFFPGLAALLTPALIAYGAWGLFAGVRLFKLGRGHAQPAATPG
jgi:hypothetical protein